jgi:hypothetical protein
MSSPWDLRFPWDLNISAGEGVNSVSMCRRAYEQHPTGMRHIKMGHGRYMSFVTFTNSADYAKCNVRHFWPRTLNRSVMSVLHLGPATPRSVYRRSSVKDMMLLAMHGRPLRTVYRTIDSPYWQAVYVRRCAQAIYARNLLAANAVTSEALYARFPALSYEFLDEIAGVISDMVGCPCRYCMEL